VCERVEQAYSILILANQALVEVINDGLELKLEVFVAQELV